MTQPDPSSYAQDSIDEPFDSAGYEAARGIYVAYCDGWDSEEALRAEPRGFISDDDRACAERIISFIERRRTQ